MFKKNVSATDRTIRVILALLFLFLAMGSTGWLMTIFYVLAIVMLVTAATGFCALYSIFGFSTQKTEKKDEHAGEVKEENQAS